MGTITQPLREEHQELLPKIERIRHVADSVGVLPIGALYEQVVETHAFLSRELIPHAKAEDAALYPVVARVMGAPEATATMRHDHVEVAGLVDELGAMEPELSGITLSFAAERALRRILYGLYALVKVHFIEEEEIYLPILDAGITEDEARDMFRSMEAVAACEKERVGA